MSSTIKINAEYSVKEFVASTGDQVVSLLRIKDENMPEVLRSWIGQQPSQEEIEQEMVLNDWSRWNTELPPGQEVEISEAVYDHLLNCMPPRRWSPNYFEVAEPTYIDPQGQPIHRACWITDGRYYTGYPKP